jgi:hypothetical protein
MRRILLSFLFAFTASHASAEACPDKYRFVDFGLEDSSGALLRGGTIFRAFLPDNTPLLIKERTVCEDVHDLGKDGRSLDIPVVSRISVNTALIDLEFLELDLTKVTDVTALATENASKHQKAQRTAELTRGEVYVCATTRGDSTSCQLLSPFENNIPLVVYCDGTHCKMPVLAFDDKLMFSAVWPRHGTSPTDIGQDISQKLTQLRDFLSQHMDF